MSENIMNEDIRRSKIYSYFYGKNTVFQQFLIVVGVVIAFFSNCFATNQHARLIKLEEEYESKKDVAEAYYDDYQSLYSQYYYDFDIEFEEKVPVSDNDKLYEQKYSYNNALEMFQEARSDADSSFVKYYRAIYGTAPDYRDSSESYSSYASLYDDDVYYCYEDYAGGLNLFVILGGLVVVAGLIWIGIKKIFPNKKEGEEAVDLEVQIRIKEAKSEALNKLNIVAEQIEKVEPVLLCGIANQDNNAAVLRRGLLSKLIQSIAKLFISIEPLLLSAVVGGAVYFLTYKAAENNLFYVALVVSLLIAGVIGFFLFKKFEVKSFVSMRTLRKLEKIDPKLIVKLGSDDCIRVSLPAITVYMFGNEQLYMYYQYIDIVTGKVFCDGVQEYFYEDIVAVTSEQKIKKVYKRGGCLNLRLIPLDYLKESIQVITSGCRRTETYIVPVGSSLLDTRFIGMRNLIREKKMEK